MIRLMAQAVPIVFTHTAMAWAAAATVVIPITIHLLNRLRKRRQPWAAMRFLISAQRHHRHRMRLEKWLLLALRCLIPLLVGLALSGPVLRGGVGGAATLLGGLPAEQGRLVCLVIDDTLSTQAVDSTGRWRFDRLRGLALAMIEGLSPSDRIELWRSAQPAEAVSVAGGAEPSAVGEALRLMQPRYTGSDLVNALLMVSERLERDYRGDDRVFVVVLSDFAQHVVRRDQPVARQLADLGKRARLLVTRPMPEVANVQITALKTQQRVILAAPGQPSPTVPIELHLRRFVDDESRSTANVELAVFNEGLKEQVAVSQLDHHWSNGQSEAVIHALVPLTQDGDGLITQEVFGAAGAGLLAVRARITGGKGADALEADNDRWSVLAVQQRLRIGLIDKPMGLSGSSGVLTPLRWVRLALEPNRAIGSNQLTSPPAVAAGATTMSLELLPASNTNEQSLRAFDVAMVLRPDLLSEQGWVGLRSLADRGGLVWLFPPPAGPVGSWASKLRDHMGLHGQLGNESDLTRPHAVDGQALSVDDPAPQPLKLLAADWRALLAPVRVRKRFDWTVPGSATPQELFWLKTADDEPLLVSAVVGQGRVLVWTTAIDPRWCNLPTKPLFVPLLHETIRGVLAETGFTSGHREVTCAERPTLGDPWGSAAAMVLGTRDGAGLAAVRLVQTDTGLRPESVLRDPGVYTTGGASGPLLAVNPDASGGDTTATDLNQLTQWLSVLGRWSWLDGPNPARHLVVEQRRTGLSWPLLWLALGFAVVEMFTARWFSHAVLGGSGWLGWSRGASLDAGDTVVVGQGVS